MTPPVPLNYTPQQLGPGSIEFDDSTVRHFDSIVVLSSGVLQTDTDVQRVLYSPFFWKIVTYDSGTKTLLSSIYRSAPSN